MRLPQVTPEEREIQRKISRHNVRAAIIYAIRLNPTSRSKLLRSLVESQPLSESAPHAERLARMRESVTDQNLSLGTPESLTLFDVMAVQVDWLHRRLTQALTHVPAEYAQPIEKHVAVNAAINYPSGFVFESILIIWPWTEDEIGKAIYRPFLESTDPRIHELFRYLRETNRKKYGKEDPKPEWLVDALPAIKTEEPPLIQSNLAEEVIARWNSLKSKDGITLSAFAAHLETYFARAGWQALNQIIAEAVHAGRIRFAPEPDIRRLSQAYSQSPSGISTPATVTPSRSTSNGMGTSELWSYLANAFAGRPIEEFLDSYGLAVYESLKKLAHKPQYRLRRIVSIKQIAADVPHLGYTPEFTTAALWHVIDALRTVPTEMDDDLRHLLDVLPQHPSKPNGPTKKTSDTTVEKTKGQAKHMGLLLTDEQRERLLTGATRQDINVKSDDVCSRWWLTVKARLHNAKRNSDGKDAIFNATWPERIARAVQLAGVKPAETAIQIRLFAELFEDRSKLLREILKTIDNLNRVVAVNPGSDSLGGFLVNDKEWQAAWMEDEDRTLAILKPIVLQFVELNRDGLDLGVAMAYHEGFEILARRTFAAAGVTPDPTVVDLLARDIERLILGELLEGAAVTPSLLERAIGLAVILIHDTYKAKELLLQQVHSAILSAWKSIRQAGEVHPGIPPSQEYFNAGIRAHARGNAINDLDDRALANEATHLANRGSIWYFPYELAIRTDRIVFELFLATAAYLTNRENDESEFRWSDFKRRVIVPVCGSVYNGIGIVGRNWRTIVEFAKIKSPDRITRRFVAVMADFIIPRSQLTREQAAEKLGLSLDILKENSDLAAADFLLGDDQKVSQPPSLLQAMLQESVGPQEPSAQRTQPRPRKVWGLKAPKLTIQKIIQRLNNEARRNGQSNDALGLIFSQFRRLQMRRTVDSLAEGGFETVVKHLHHTTKLPADVVRAGLIKIAKNLPGLIETETHSRDVVEINRGLIAAGVPGARQPILRAQNGGTLAWLWTGLFAFSPNTAIFFLGPVCETVANYVAENRGIAVWTVVLVAGLAHMAGIYCINPSTGERQVMSAVKLKQIWKDNPPVSIYLMEEKFTVPAVLLVFIFTFAVPALVTFATFVPLLYEWEHPLAIGIAIHFVLNFIGALLMPGAMVNEYANDEGRADRPNAQVEYERTLIAKATAVFNLRMVLPEGAQRREELSRLTEERARALNMLDRLLVMSRLQDVKGITLQRLHFILTDALKDENFADDPAVQRSLDNLHRVYNPGGSPELSTSSRVNADETQARGNLLVRWNIAAGLAATEIWAVIVPFINGDINELDALAHSGVIFAAGLATVILHELWHWLVAELEYHYEKHILGDGDENQRDWFWIFSSRVVGFQFASTNPFFAFVFLLAPLSGFIIYGGLKLIPVSPAMVSAALLTTILINGLAAFPLHTLVSIFSPLHWRETVDNTDGDYFLIEWFDSVEHRRFAFQHLLDRWNAWLYQLPNIVSWAWTLMRFRLLLSEHERNTALRQLIEEKPALALMINLADAEPNQIAGLLRDFKRLDGLERRAIELLFPESARRTLWQKTYALEHPWGGRVRREIEAIHLSPAVKTGEILETLGLGFAFWLASVGAPPFHQVSYFAVVAVIVAVVFASNWVHPVVFKGWSNRPYEPTRLHRAILLGLGLLFLAPFVWSAVPIPGVAYQPSIWTAGLLSFALHLGYNQIARRVPWDWILATALTPNSIDKLLPQQPLSYYGGGTDDLVEPLVKAFLMTSPQRRLNNLSAFKAYLDSLPQIPDLMVNASVSGLKTKIEELEKFARQQAPLMKDIEVFSQCLNTMMDYHDEALTVLIHSGDIETADGQPRLQGYLADVLSKFDFGAGPKLGVQPLKWDERYQGNIAFMHHNMIYVRDLTVTAFENAMLTVFPAFEMSQEAGIKDEALLRMFFYFPLIMIGYTANELEELGVIPMVPDQKKTDRFNFTHEKVYKFGMAPSKKQEHQKHRYPPPHNPNTKKYLRKPAGVVHIALLAVMGAPIALLFEQHFWAVAITGAVFAAAGVATASLSPARQLAKDIAKGNVAAVLNSPRSFHIDAALEGRPTAEDSRSTPIAVVDLEEALRVEYEERNSANLEKPRLPIVTIDDSLDSAAMDELMTTVLAKQDDSAPAPLILVTNPEREQEIEALPFGGRFEIVHDNRLFQALENGTDYWMDDAVLGQLLSERGLLTNFDLELLFSDHIKFDAARLKRRLSLADYAVILFNRLLKAVRLKQLTEEERLQADRQLAQGA